MLPHITLCLHVKVLVFSELVLASDWCGVMGLLRCVWESDVPDVWNETGRSASHTAGINELIESTQISPSLTRRVAD